MRIRSQKRKEILLANPKAQSIVASVERALLSYGDGVPQVILWNFKKKTRLPTQAIATKPEEFVACLHEIFGAGARAIEDRLTQQICSDYKVDRSKVSGLAQAIKLALSSPRWVEVGEMEEEEEEDQWRL